MPAVLLNTYSLRADALLENIPLNNAACISPILRRRIELLTSENAY